MKPSEPPLRQFLYLDVPFVADSLSQMEGGSYDSETRTTEETRSRGLKGEVGVGNPFASLKVGGGKDKAVREEVQRTINRTDAVRFAQFYSLLMNQSRIRELSVADPEIWEQLEPGEFIEIQAIVAPSTLSKTVDVLVAKGKWLADILTLLGYDVTEDARSIASTQSRRRPAPTFIRLVASLARLNVIEALPKLLIIASLVGSPDYKFVAHLTRTHLLVTSVVELASDMKVLGRLEQKLTNPYRIGGLSPEVIRRLQSSIEDEALSQTLVKTATKYSSVEPPAAVFQPVAIYR